MIEYLKEEWHEPAVVVIWSAFLYVTSSYWMPLVVKLARYLPV
jgi:hypothetical protein